MQRARLAGAPHEQLFRCAIGRPRGRDALQTGQVDGGLVWAGQVVGLIEDIPSCEALIQRMVAECLERLDVGRRCFV